jgi:hypothetical protein
MTYTVYTPDISRGPTAYTLHTFTSMKDLARWAMNIALEEPALVITEVPTPVVPVTPSPPVSVKVDDILQVEVTTELVDVLEQSRKSAQEESSTEVISMPDISEWDIDMDVCLANCTNAKYKEVIEAAIKRKDAKFLALEFIDKVATTAFKEYMPTAYHEKDSTTRQDIITSQDYAFFIELAVMSISYISEDLLEDNYVRWELLPSAFKEALLNNIPSSKVLINTNVFRAKATTTKVIVPSSILAKNLFQILKFFKEGRRHKSWEQAVITYNDKKWTFETAYDITQSLVHAWWSGAKTTDEIREFLLKVTAIQVFKNTKIAVSIGSAELIDVYMKNVYKIGLPTSFVDWATKGTRHSHCKKAFSEIDIPQVRRSEGQRYVNIELISENSKGVETDEPWLFLDTLTYTSDKTNFYANPTMTEAICLTEPFWWDIA